MAAWSSPAVSLAIQRVKPQIRMTPLGDSARLGEGNTRDIGKRKHTITDLQASCCLCCPYLQHLAMNALTSLIRKKHLTEKILP